MEPGATTPGYTVASGKHVSSMSDEAQLYAKSHVANELPQHITLGIACMSKKFKQPTMQAFLRCFTERGFSIVPFAEDVLLEQPVTEWPAVDCCIMFFSAGFPLDKAVEYERLHQQNTFFLVHPSAQQVLLDRRTFYKALRRNNIPTPRHAFCSRDGHDGAAEPVVEEHVDYIVLDGERFNKPFVEKPVDTEDHNVYIYYPASMGGGCRKLFRKRKNESSMFDPDCNTIRRDGSFIYETFIEAQNPRDIKCYTVGPDYVHAEGRKAPTVDGVVLRDENGKEVREIIPLSPGELMVARKITKVFRQMVCGFDLLRGDHGDYYVCDVNGWSFVKNNDGYVERASAIMTSIFRDEVGKRGLHRVFRRQNTPRELVGTVGVFRHADRTPKQKVKLRISDSAILHIAFGDARHVKEEATYKTGHPKIEEVRQAVTTILSSEEALKAAAARSVRGGIRDPHESLRLIADVLTREQEGLRIQIKPRDFDADGRCVDAQLVCKWGGWLTDPGQRQAATLGHHFAERVFGHECKATYMDGVEVTTNNERRVIKTAHCFLDGTASTTEVIVDDGLLGDNSHAKEHLDNCTDTISSILHLDSAEEAAPYLDLPGFRPVVEHPVLGDRVRTPYNALCKVLELVHGIADHVDAHMAPETQLYRGEPVELCKQRWRSLCAAYCCSRPGDAAEARRFDVSKLPDVFDYVSYDTCYNQPALAPLDLYPLFTLAQALSAFVSEGECGLTTEDKFLCGSLIGEPLMQRIYTDLTAIASDGDPKTRLYFTSASHVNALRHVLYHSGEAPMHNIGDALELHFLTHLVFKVYRYPNASAEQSPTHSGVAPPQPLHQIEVHFSTGVDKNMFGIVQDHHASYTAVSPMIRVHNNLEFATLFRVAHRSAVAFNGHRCGKTPCAHVPLPAPPRQSLSERPGSTAVGSPTTPEPALLP